MQTENTIVVVIISSARATRLNRSPRTKPVAAATIAIASMLSPHLRNNPLEVRRPPMFFFVAGKHPISPSLKYLGDVTFRAHLFCSDVIHDKPRTFSIAL